MRSLFSLWQYTVFVTVADQGGIRGAAEQLGRTTSAISMMLKQMEQEAGAPLFEGERKTTLTRFGKFAYDQARSLLEHSDRVSRSLGAHAQNGEGQIETALLPSVAAAFLPKTLLRLSVEAPTISVRVRDLDTQGIQQAVSHEHVEIGIASYSSAVAIRYEALFSEPLAVVCKCDDPLSRLGRPVEWTDLADHDLIANNSYMRTAIPDILSRESKAPKLEILNIISLLAVVRAGVGITILPALSRHQDKSGLAFLRIADPTARRTVYMLTHADRSLSPAAQRFADVLKSVISEHAEEYQLSFDHGVPHGRPGA